MATLINDRTGASISVDIESYDRDDPADLPSAPVEDGLPVTYQRYRAPTSVAIRVLLPLVPTGDANADVRAFLDEAAREADRLTLSVPGEPDVTNLKIGPRRTSLVPGTTTVRIDVALQEVRQIRATTGIEFPAVRSDLSSGRQASEDGGRQSTQPADRSLLLSVLGVGG